MNCYCGQQEPFYNCCLKVHTGKNHAKTAEQLMRARYSAFASSNVDFIKRTMKSPALDKFSKKDTKLWLKKVSWLRLEVLRSEKGLEHDSEGWVEFKAFYKQDGKNHVIHETSYFKNIESVWYYIGEVQEGLNGK